MLIERVLASGGVALRKTKPVITEASALSPRLVLSPPVSLPMVGSQVRVPPRALPPRQRHHRQPPSATMSVVVSLSHVLEFRSCSCGTVQA